MTSIIIIIYILLRLDQIITQQIIPPCDFYNLTSERYFVDKTQLIRSVYFQPHKFIYISRPRKYGKSMNLNMLNLFFNVQVDKHGNTKNYTRTTPYLRVFRHLDIANDTQFIEQHMTNYPVLLLDLKHMDKIALENITDETVVKYLNIMLHESLKSYQWLLDIPKEKLTAFNSLGDYSIEPEDISFMEKLQRKELNYTEIETSLGKLIKILNVYFQRQVIVLIDEYDRLLLHAKMVDASDINLLNNMIDKIISYMLKREVKSMILRSLIVGTDKKSMFRQDLFVENFVPQWSLDDDVITSYFGFSSLEVRTLFEKYNCGLQSQSTFKNFYSKYETAREKDAVFYNPYATAIFFANNPKNQCHHVDHWFLQIDKAHILDGLFS